MHAVRLTFTTKNGRYDYTPENCYYGSCSIIIVVMNWGTLEERVEIVFSSLMALDNVSFYKI